DDKMEQEVKRMAKKLDAMVKKKSTVRQQSLKQSSDEEVQSLAKSLIKTWKKLLDDSKEDEKKDGSPLILPSSSSSSSPPQTHLDAPDLAPKAHKSTPKITTFPPVPVTSDSVRTKCKELLESALQTGDDYKTIGADCTRSADEPMTTFVVCNGCGNRWKVCILPHLVKYFWGKKKKKIMNTDLASCSSVRMQNLNSTQMPQEKLDLHFCLYILF
uniref:Transcription elongation factor A (SII), 2 n=1 Tax=Denticeps clupeoides TaxID=299321 RepID=A0AAY4ECK9_9TELE